jgi:HPt (histidine-containing phosphotransfer) domain-containing protein
MADSGASKIPVAIEQELMPVIDEYLERRWRDCAEIERLLVSGCMDGISFLAHQLKGSGGSFGFDEISDIGEALGHAAREPDEGGIRAAVGRLERFLACVVVEYV